MKRQSLLLFLVAGLLFTSCTSNSGGNSETPPAPNMDFIGVTWSDATYTYDGNQHRLGDVKGAPEGTNISYTGRDYFTNVGSYTATALLTKKGYNDLTLTATLNITKANFRNISFTSKTIEYDGQQHSVVCTGVPSYAQVVYENNTATEVGTYSATATITADNYNTLVLHATLTITAPLLDFTDAYMDDETVTYDGYSHTIAPKGYPDGTSIKYSGTYQYTNAGTYTITCKLTKEGYHEKTLSAKLTITPIKPSGNYYFSDETFMYDGQYHSITVSTNTTYTITYKCLNKTGTNRFKDPGVYNIQATIKQDNNHIAYLTATMTIVDMPENGLFGVDSNKTPLTIDDDLLWDTLFEAIKGDNYTVRTYSSSYDTDDEDFDAVDVYETNSGYTTFACDGQEATLQGDLVSYDGEAYSVYGFYFLSGDDFIDFEFYTNDYSGEMSKAPKEAFSETIVKPTSAGAFAPLTKGDDGKFYPGMDLDSYEANTWRETGHYVIKDNKFVVITQHPRTTSGGFNGYKYRYFYVVREYFNIGNTVITIPELLRNEMHPEDLPVFSDYVIDGIAYGRHLVSTYNSPYELMAHTYLTRKQQMFLEPGVHIVRADVYGTPVQRVVHRYYTEREYNYDMSGYEINVYFDENGNYCGEYAEFGTVTDKTSNFVSRGGVVHYYNEWANA